MDNSSQAKAQALLAVAGKHLEAGEVRQARAVLDRILALVPDHAQALELTARCAAGRSGSDAPDLTVAVVTRNRVESLRRCLGALETQTLPAKRFEVLVVDDGSTDATPGFLAGYRPPFAFWHVAEPRAVGSAEACNTALRAARGEVVVLLGDDVRLAPDGLAVHLAVHEAVPEGDFIVRGRIDRSPETGDSLWEHLLAHSDLVLPHLSLERNKLYGHAAFSSRNSSVRRKNLLAAGLFDTALTDAAAGDADCGSRLHDLPTPVPVLYRDDCAALWRPDLDVDGFVALCRQRGLDGATLAAKHGLTAPYPGLCDEDLRFWRNLPRRLTERMEGLAVVIRRAGEARPLLAGAPPAAIGPQDAEDLPPEVRRLWSLRTRDLLALAEAAAGRLDALLSGMGQGRLALVEAARALYPAVLFLRFFHETAGACLSPDIDRFCGKGPAPAPAVTISEASRGRILLACNFFWPSVGGTELLVEHLGTRLRDSGYEVHVACRHQVERRALVRNGLRIHQFRCHNRFFDPFMGPDTEAYRRHVAEGGYKAALVLAHPDSWSCHLLRDLPAPRPRLIFMPSVNAENARLWEERGVTATVVGTLRAADALIAVSESGHDRRMFVELGLPHAFIPHAVEDEAMGVDARARFALDKDRPLLACVGNFWPVKNQAALLAALAAAPGDWQLALAGAALPWAMEQEYFDACWELARADRRVRMLGPLPPLEAAALIRDADALLVPSLGESAGPLVVLQAMSFATPWVATPACNAVADEAGGLVSPLDRFPEAITALLAQPAKAAALGGLGREHWRASFTWERSLPVFLDLIEHRKVSVDLAMPAQLRDRQAVLARTLLTGPAGA